MRFSYWMCITSQCEMSIKNYPFVIYVLRSWKMRLDSQVSLFLTEVCHCINCFSFVLRESYVLFFKKWQVNTRFISLWLHHKPTFLWSSPLQTWRILLFNNDNWGAFMQDSSLNLAFIGYFRSLFCWTCPDSWRTSIVRDLGRVDLSFWTLDLVWMLWVLSLRSASKFFCLFEPTFLGDNFVVLRILCLLIVQFLQDLLASKSENKILQLVVVPSGKCPPLGQSLIACQLNRSQLLPDKLRRPGTVSTSQWEDHNRLSGCRRHRKWGKWLKSTFSSLELKSINGVSTVCWVKLVIVWWSLLFISTIHSWQTTRF